MTRQLGLTFALLLFTAKLAADVISPLPQPEPVTPDEVRDYR
jgi:hypothetical protein